MLLVFRDLLLFAGVVLFGGAALAPRPWSSQLEAWCIGIACAIATLGLSVFVPYALGLGPSAYSLGYLLLAGVAIYRLRSTLAILRDPDVILMSATWGLLVAGCLFLLACVSSYSGGAWVGDWEEHYQRPLLYLRLRAEDAEFMRRFTLTARPPLANVTDAALMWVTGAEFARHQTFMLLLNSLAYFPAVLFCRAFGGGRAAPAVVAFFLLLNPAFVQNATYAWTKSITGLFVLLGLHILLSAPLSLRRTIYGFGMLGLGAATHYSACVWALAFGIPWLIVQRDQWRSRVTWQNIAGAAAAFLGMLSPWLIYAISRYGLKATFGSNSTVVDSASFNWVERAMNMAQNLWSTLVPHFLRDFDRSLVTQANPWTAFRDYVFFIYQTNLFFTLGTPALILIIWMGRRRYPLQSSWRTVWLIAIPLVIVLGTAVHGTPDRWGLAHICLLPLALIGVALAATQVSNFLRTHMAPCLLICLGTAWAVDFFLGIALHYRATAFELNRGPDQSLLDYLATLTPFAQRNFWQKISLKQDYFADGFSFGSAQCLLGVIAIALLLGLLAFRLAPRKTRSGPGHQASLPTTV
jgi:hypothetical protein